MKYFIIFNFISIFGLHIIIVFTYLIIIIFLLILFILIILILKFLSYVFFLLVICPNSRLLVHFQSHLHWNQISIPIIFTIGSQNLLSTSFLTIFVTSFLQLIFTFRVSITFSLNYLF